MWPVGVRSHAWGRWLPPSAWSIIFSSPQCRSRPSLSSPAALHFSIMRERTRFRFERGGQSIYRKGREVPAFGGTAANQRRFRLRRLQALLRDVFLRRDGLVRERPSVLESPRRDFRLQPEFGQDGRVTRFSRTIASDSVR